jgi:hypothetical protein
VARDARTKGVTVSRLQTMQVTRSRRDRDAELRGAHQRAFTKIHGAKGSADYRDSVARAVEELVDACEAYIDRT